MKESGVIFVLLKDNKILMQQRDGNCKKFPYMWCIPGGGQDDGESYEETLLREIKEEFNIDLKIEQCKYIMNYIDESNKVYLCNLYQNQIPVFNEGMDMKWMSINEIKNIKLGFNQDNLILLLEDYFKIQNI